MGRKSETPPTLHIATSGAKLCGYVQEGSWPEKFLEDSVARTLELCEACLTHYTEQHGEEAAENLLANIREPRPIQDRKTDTPVESSPNESPVSYEPEPTQMASGEAPTLREYLAM